MQCGVYSRSDSGIGARMYAPELVTELNSMYRKKGVELLAGATVTACEERGWSQVLLVRDLQLSRQREVIVDGVVAGTGTEPNVELARAAGLTVDNGIRVDSPLCTSDPSTYAAGDRLEGAMP